MIFDENFDRALWLLVANNKSEREKICKLIRYIPKRVYKEIRLALFEYYNNGVEVKNNIVYETNLKNVKGYDYYVTVKVIGDKLYFNVLRWNEDKERVEEEYQLILKEIFSDYLTNMEYGDKCSIGKYKHEINNIKYEGYSTSVDTEEYDRRYNLTRFPFGFVIVSLKKRLPVRRQYVNVFKNMPDEIYVEDFRSEKRIEGLVKKRKRTR